MSVAPGFENPPDRTGQIWELNGNIVVVVKPGYVEDDEGQFSLTGMAWVHEVFSFHDERKYAYYELGSDTTWEMDGNHRRIL